MLLVIHAGTHKTATTAFQLLCTANQSQLITSGVYYPRVEGQYHHSSLAWLLQQRRWNQLEKFLDETRIEAKRLRCNVAFLSGEDFENLLVNTHEVPIFERIARKAGFRRTHWFFTVRDSYEYFESLYSELSKHHICLNYLAAAKVILTHGYFSVINVNYHYKFVFDFEKFYQQFQVQARGKVSRLSYSEFTDTFPGRALLQLIGVSREVLEMFTANYKPTFTNPRPDPSTVEANYLANFLETHLPTQQEDAELHRAVRAIEELRMASAAHARSEVKAAFEKAFGR